MYRRLSVFAPLATLFALVALSRVMPARADIDVRAIERQSEIAQTMASAPFLIGGWIGADAPVPPEAQKLLRPNAMLSRTYSQLGRPSVHVVVVHCSDARDMIGHYPPICYPSAGWVAMPVLENVFADIEAAGKMLPVRQYLYRRIRENGAEDRIRIFSAFVLPDGTVTRDIDDINEQSERLAVSIQGVAQLQLITDASTEYSEAAKAAGEILSGMPELLTSLGVEGTPQARTVAFVFQGQGADDRVR
jgi:hypothetical protein